MEFEFIRFAQSEDGIATVTLHRPERLNALHGPMMRELLRALRAIEEDPAIRVWLLTGAPRADGRPNFGAGVDLRAFAEGCGVDGFTGQQLTNDIDDLLKPSIAVIDGVCTTGAVELALACDFRLVAPSAQISDWHLKNLGTGLGGWGASTRWSRLVGVQRTKEIILTGKVLGGEEAVRIGFATAVHPSDLLMREALVMAGSIAAMRPEGVALTLAHLDHNMDMSRDQSLRWAQLAPKWLGVETGVEGKDEELLGKSRRS